MAFEVLMPSQMRPFVIQELEAAGALHRLWEETDEDAALARLAPTVQAMIVSGWSKPVDAALMQRCPRLELIAISGAGYEKIDAKWAGAHGIIVTNGARALANECADTAMALLLNAVRRFPQAERYMRAGKWREASFPLTATLRHRTMGIVGLGRIGKEIARRAEVFGIKIVYTGRHAQKDAPYRYYASVVEMAKDCDTLVMALPGDPTTHKIASREALEALGPEGVVVNISRGSVIDEDAMIDLLRTNKLLAAGLDVFTTEPEINPAFYELDNVALSPHCAAGSHDSRSTGQRIACDNVLSWIARKGPLDPVLETPWPATAQRKSA
jgi:lactate dehydrogenase-like 2-hydroxyacid dehydrogenase